jgi:hypothetical protein
VHGVDSDIQKFAFDLLHRLPPHVLAPHAPALARPLVLATYPDKYLVSLLSKLNLCVDPEVIAALCAALAADDF